MTGRDLIHKWFIYSLGLLLVWVLDAFILSRYPIWGVSPSLLPLAVAAVAVLEGACGGAGFGLGVGLLWVLTYPTSGSWLVLLLTLAGRAAGAASQYVLSKSYPGFLLCALGVMILLDLPRILHRFLFQFADPAALFHLAIRECALSLLWSPAVYFIFWLVYRRVGGTRLA